MMGEEGGSSSGEEHHGTTEIQKVFVQQRSSVGDIAEVEGGAAAG